MTARLRFVTTDGRTFDREQLTLRGSLADPLSWTDLETKFRANVRGRVSEAAALESVARIATLQDQKDLTEFGALLHS